MMAGENKEKKEKKEKIRQARQGKSSCMYAIFSLFVLVLLIFMRIQCVRKRQILQVHWTDRYDVYSFWNPCRS